MAREIDPEIIIDGPMQADTALFQGNRRLSIHDLRRARKRSDLS